MTDRHIGSDESPDVNAASLEVMSMPALPQNPVLSVGMTRTCVTASEVSGSEL